VGVNDDVIEALREQQDELEGLIGSLDQEGWRRPSRCEGWSVADVVLHLAQTDELAIASAEGRFGDVIAALAGGDAVVSSIDEGVDVMVARERDIAPAELLERWRRAAHGFADLAADDPHRRVTWVAGDMTLRTLATTRLSETWIHTVDVAAGLGVDLAPTDRLWHIARLAWRTVPYAFARDGAALTGPVAFELRGPNGDDWTFAPDVPAATVVRGEAIDLCGVAGQRRDAADTGLRAEGPDADAVLALVRTYA
jgi:uncharacterized protein (TIGR03084 family)